MHVEARPRRAGNRTAGRSVGRYLLCMSADRPSTARAALAPLVLLVGAAWVALQLASGVVATVAAVVKLLVLLAVAALVGALAVRVAARGGAVARPS